MTELIAVTLREIRLPLREPFRISSGTVSERRILLLELRDANGATAWSECVAGEDPNYSPETIDTAWLAIARWVAPRLLFHAVEAPGEAHRLLECDFRGHQMAKAAVEMGLWAMEAERLGMSLSRLIGGTRDEVAVGISLGIQRSPEALAGRVRDALALGYRKVKIKIAPGADVDYVRAARAATGPDAPLMADANNAYTLDTIDPLLALDDLDLMMIEQPLAHDDLVRHAELQRRLRTPICLDESITSLERAQDMVTLGSGRIVNIKPGRVGGFTSSIAIHDFCEAHGIPVWCGGMLESGIGRAYNVALASLPNFVKPGDISPSARYWERDIVKPEWTMSPEGLMRVPVERPGLGIEVDRDRVEDLTVRAETVGEP
ncbi:MAG TPA: o-succinylbenzoate synthase [Gemmatimonadaceae bacterium]|nr:o-succinylbenzoate synthase [Gemmatimonadaceae bacterium]